MDIYGDLHGWISNFCHIYGHGGYPHGRRERDRAPGPNLGAGPSHIFSSVIVK